SENKSQFRGYSINLHKLIDSTHLDLDDIFIAYNKATSIALVINELIINCFKHAFTNMDTGTIHIQCKNYYEHIFISVRDNGHGLPDDFDPTKVKSLGLSILHGIVTSEFQGEIRFKSANGTKVEILIPFQSFSLNQYREKEEI
ncbi:ATP-binding protein, partial [Lentibacillus sp. L22]|uniref:sensor histidine kinase n=1 Tax=Lentibacillus sp. L22 TaxID=3163028 RepID=UPI00346680AD